MTLTDSAGGTVQNKFAYDDARRNLTTEWQAHSGSVIEGTTPAVG